MRKLILLGLLGICAVFILAATFIATPADARFLFDDCSDVEEVCSDLGGNPDINTGPGGGAYYFVTCYDGGGGGVLWYRACVIVV